MGITIELSYNKITGTLTAMTNDFNLFHTPCKDYVYQNGKLSEVILNEPFKHSTSFFTVYINRYDYALQDKFIRELKHIVYDITGVSPRVNNPFEKPKDDNYEKHTLDFANRKIRDIEIIEEMFNKKIFGEWYTKEYPDFETIEILMRINETFIPVGGQKYLDIESVYEGDRIYYKYTGNLDKKFNEWFLERV